MGREHLLGRAVWDHDGVRDDVRADLVEALGDPEAVLVIDETGDLKKGTRRWGYSASTPAPRVENAQVAVYLVGASDGGHALIDREQYVPRGWIEDPDRCRLAGIPAQVGFAIKPALATRMLARSLDAGVPAAWVIGDEVYSADPGLRAELQIRGVGSVLAVACDHRVVTAGDAYRADACSRGFRRGPGSWCRPGAAPTATATTTGRSSAWTVILRLAARLVSGDCCCAATAPPVSWPSTPAGRLARSPWPPWSGRRTPLGDQGARPDRQGPGRPGSASGSSLALLVPLDHPGHGRPRPPRGARGHAPYPPPAIARADQLDLQPGPAPARDAARPSRW
jgi:hypothetical protein